MQIIKTHFSNKNWLESMPRKNLKAYIMQLVDRLTTEPKGPNTELFLRWLKEARAELQRRDEIIRYYANKKDYSK